jgi:anthranilate synthase/aminodeoxychorismate synthase-like glutamine amidotransferase
MSSVLLVDHHDSFTFNVWQLVESLGARCEVVLADAIDVEEVRRRKPVGIILSPGPCTPREAGASPAIALAVARGDIDAPLLGICLGHQVIAASLGASVGRARRPVHGRATPIRHDGRGIFEGVPSPSTQARYHSLVVDPDTLPDELEACAWSDEGELMALRHRTAPIDAVQFHPESFLSEHGRDLIGRWLERTHRA